MPLYDYKCSNCGTVREVRHGFNDTHDQPCSVCGGAMMRVFNPAPIVFKGSGFYKTDSRAKTETKSESKSETSESKTETKSESKTETKSESKPETKSEAKTEVSASSSNAGESAA
ncbi:MAG TPA: FmdB family zinc ribbon protein [Candidatus Baltobacteraceae bacterium]|jgi:putative FmdB family regulatory protein|nr:FmdB family zinc ribbon protein [Candidatus Baltobacteraceae bacterium]